MPRQSSAHAETEHEWITVDEAADYLRIGRRQAYDAVHSGELPAIKIGTQYRIYRQHLSQLSADTYERAIILQQQIKATQDKLGKLAATAQAAARNIQDLTPKIE